MIVSMKKNTPQQELLKMREHFESLGLGVHEIPGNDTVIFGLTGDIASIDESSIKANPFVEVVRRISVPFKLANRAFHPQDSIIQVGDQKIGGQEKIALIAGPCSVESLDQIVRIAKEVKTYGANFLRGGAYKPRTSPYTFQGLGTEGVNALIEAKKETELPIVSELMSSDKLEEFIEKVDVIQIGARNMQNYDLLKAVGQCQKPILLKRGLSATIEEWIMSAEYILAAGNPNVILCERGIRSFEKYTRNTMDLAVIPIIKQRTHLPIIVDPSHACGNWTLIESISLAAIAAGADGLLIEVHDQPEQAWSDGAQSLKPQKFGELVQKAKKVAEAIGREL